MLDALIGIEGFTKGMTYNDFVNDPKTQAAVERYIEILGEAANKLPNSFYTKHTQIPWHKVISMRNRIIHAYFNVDKSIVWNIVTSYLPKLKEQIEELQGREGQRC